MSLRWAISRSAASCSAGCGCRSSGRASRQSKRGSSGCASGPPTASSSTFLSVSAREQRAALGGGLVRELARTRVEAVEVATRGGKQALERRHQFSVERDGHQERVVRLQRHGRRIGRMQPRELAALLLEHLLGRQVRGVDGLQALARLLDASIELALALLPGAESLELGAAMLGFQPAPHTLLFHRDRESI